MLVIIILGFTIVLAGWFTGEVMRWPLLSIPCCLVAIVSVGVVSYGFGRLAAWTDTSIRLTGATDTFFETAAKCLDAGEDAKVHEELRRLDDVNWTYEGEAYAAQLDEASQRLSATSSAVSNPAN